MCQETHTKHPGSGCGPCLSYIPEVLYYTVGGPAPWQGTLLLPFLLLWRCLRQIVFTQPLVAGHVGQPPHRHSHPFEDRYKLPHGHALLLQSWSEGLHDVT